MKLSTIVCLFLFVYLFNLTFTDLLKCVCFVRMSQNELELSVQFNIFPHPQIPQIMAELAVLVDPKGLPGFSSYFQHGFVS